MQGYAFLESAARHLADVTWQVAILVGIVFLLGRAFSPHPGRVSIGALAGRFDPAFVAGLAGKPDEPVQSDGDEIGTRCQYDRAGKNAF